MAEAPAPPATEDPSFQSSDPDNPTSQTSQTDPASASAAPAPPQQQSSTPVAPIPNPNPSPALVPPTPPPVAYYAPPPISGASVLPLSVPSFRPVPQFSPIPNYQNPGVPPPGVSSAPGSVPAPMMPYQVLPGQAMNPAMRPYAPMPNGFVATPQGTMNPAGLPRYLSPYPAMVRPAFPPRPVGAVGMLPGVARPLVPGIPGVRPVIPPIMRPVVPSVTPVEKPQTTVYIGKIAPTADNDFMLSLLRVCGPVKSWKRAQDPSDGTPRGFGFFEFESADGVLRALRLLSKFNIDGQELVLNVNQGTREYLERYVKKKTENAKKPKEGQAAEDGREGDGASGVKKNEELKSSAEDLKEENDAKSKDNNDVANFGIVTDEDMEGDQDALKKLTNMIDERLKTKPLPPPPAEIPADSSGHGNPDLPARLREGDSDVDITKNANDRNDDETTSDNKATSEPDKPETSSPERSRRYDRRSRDRDRDRDRDVKGDKEREIERYERDAERERVRKEREQRRKIEEAEREYVERLKEWEYRERDREKQRHQEKEKEKERERKRKKEILYDEEDEDDDSRKRWRRSALEDKRRRRQREKEDDLTDRLKEEEEIAEAKRRAEEEQQQQQLQRDALKLLSGHVINGNEKKITAKETSSEVENKAADQAYQDVGNLHHLGNEALRNGTTTNEDSATVANAEPELQQSGNAPARKLGFGLVGSGKRTSVPSVFHVEDDDDAHKDKKMRPLVPIDYSTEELQFVQPSVSGAQPVNLAAAAEFAKHISHVASKEEKPDAEKERSRRSHDRSNRRDRDRNDEDKSRNRDENKGKTYDRETEREVKTPDTKKLLDAKQLIDMIPKTKEELFSYEINWAVYDKHELHVRMRPWISKKITEFLGEEETTLVDYIVSSTQDHVKASQMLEQLQSILDEEAEMFVLKMWRMLIFEIKKVETGLSVKSRS
ncbi:RNA-binding protein 25 isoform X1 [Tripterygium wilfordii]|uniref:RNA-binding protein 25 isoform X1 n=1 Tax=Tripterygium wilfordii TaxID=458696 RepID=A0A7J7BYP6_TRIWF|nr:RNA-binding protein 25-like isoform X2 [Tripterygium wilfordii]KAF5726747.1 RNA-binding protein 25 isoform X1 [Tripterygium wilfordii]